MNFIGLLQNKGTITFLYDYKTLRQGLELMRNHGYTAMPVIAQDGHYLGTVNEGDFLWHILDYGGYEAVKDVTIKDIVKKGCNPAVTIAATPEELKEAVMEYHFVPVVDDRGMFVGIITRRALGEYLYSKSMQSEERDRMNLRKKKDELQGALA